MVGAGKTPSVVAFVPARSGSKRVKDKNIRLLGAHPLLAYSIAAASESGVFDAVVVSTDSEEYAEIARHYGAEVPALRPADIASSTSPDARWVEHMLHHLRADGRAYDCFSILRPTSPFRQPETIRRAWSAFLEEVGVDSLRAVEKCKQHPGKMWVIRGRRMLPVLPFGTSEQPWHSSQYAALPEIYIQNASLEIAWSRVVFETQTISGMTVMPFLTDAMEGFDINDEEDWVQAEQLVAANAGLLPLVSQSPHQLATGT